MSGKEFVFSVLFKGDASGAKKAAAEVKAAVAALGGTATGTVAVDAANRETAAVQKTTAARKDAARAARDQARAEKEAREAAGRATGNTLPGARPSPRGGGPAPVPAPQPPKPADLEAQKAQFVPLFKAQREYQDQLAKIAKAEAAGALTKDEAAMAVQRATRAHEWQVAALRRSDDAMAKNRRSMQLQAHEQRNLMAQMNDTAQSLALGMSPMQVLLQQGPQIIDIFGGVGNALRYLRQQLSGTRLLMGATIGSVLGGALAWDQYLQSNKNVAIAAEGRGRRLGLSAQELDAAALAGAWNADISNAQGRDLAAQLANTGRIGPQNIAPLIGSSRDIAVSTGVDPDDLAATAAKITDLFAEPAKGAQELAEKYGYITSAELEHIKQLEAQNRRYEAQAALLAALKDNLVDADKAKTMLSRGWDDVWNFGSDVASGVGGGIAYAANGGADPKLDEQIAAARAAVEKGPSMRGQSRPALQAELDRLLAQKAKADADAARLAGSESSAMARDLAEKAPANAVSQRESALRNEIAAMQEGLKAGDLSEKQRRDIERAIQGQTGALYALTNRQEYAISLDRLEMQIATERNPLRRAELAGLQAMMKAAADGASVEDQLMAATRARALAMNETIAAATNQAAAMQDEADARNRLRDAIAAGSVASADADAWLEKELTLRPLIAAAARAEGDEKAMLQGRIEDLTAAYDELMQALKADAVGADSRASEQRLAALKLETQLIGKSADERTRALAVAEAERRIADLGLDPAGPDADLKRREAAAEADARIVRDRTQRAWDLGTDQAMAGFDAAAARAANPVERAEIEAQREYARVLRETGDAEEAAARAALVRGRALAELQGTTAELMRTQDEQIARLKLEESLAGSSEIARAKALAAYEAELQIRQMGLDVNDQLAAQIRRNAELTAEQRLQTERVAEAWDKVRDAAAAAIDEPIDKLLEGDLGGALDSLARELTGFFTELSIKNPLKNWLLGANLPTLQDVGGLKGLKDWLLGKAPDSLTASTMGPVGAMTVTAGSVTITGAGAMAFGATAPGLPGNAAFAPGALAQGTNPVSMAGLPFSAASMARLEGVDTRLIEILTLAKQTSGLDFEIGEGMRSKDRQAEMVATGKSQTMNSKHLTGSALDIVLKNPDGSPNWNFNDYIPLAQHAKAAAAKLGYADQFTWGGDWKTLKDGVHFQMDTPAQQTFSAGAASADRAIAALGETASQTTGTLGNLGQGFDLFGGALGKMAQGLGQGAAGGAGGGFLDTVLTGLFGVMGVPGFAGGGQHRGGLRIVGEKGPELEFTGPSTIVPAELTRSILTAGRAPSMGAAPNVVQLQPVLVNNTGRAMEMQVEETTDSRGQKQQQFVLSDASGDGLSTRGGRAQRVLRDEYGVKRLPRKRPA